MGARPRAARRRTSRASGRATATTTTATRGKSSATRATDLAARRPWSSSSRRRRGTKSIVLDVPDWPGHRAGQHVDVRLTAEDGYQAQRSYSIASAPEDDRARADGRAARRRRGLALPRRRAAGRRRARAARPDRRLLRLGGARSAGRCCCVAGGSGVVPFRAMLRHRARGREHGAGAAAVLGALAGRGHLPRRAGGDGRRRRRRHQLHADPRAARRTGRGTRRRIDGELLGEVAWPPSERPLDLRVRPDRIRRDGAPRGLVALGHEPGRIRTERFGGTGS